MSSDERRWINALCKLAAEHPDECIILEQPETNGGFIYGKFPQKWVKVRPPRQIVMDEERRANLVENLRVWRDSQRKENDGDGV